MLDDWIPSQKTLPREEALLELANRYFTSRAPVALEDFIWWSGLPVADAKAGLEAAKHLLIRETFNEKTYWLPYQLPTIKKKRSTFLLAGFDEYLISYRDRSHCLDPKFSSKAIYSNGIFHPTIVVDGQVVGIWRPLVKKNNIEMRLNFFATLSNPEQAAVEKEIERYKKFAGI